MWSSIAAAVFFLFLVCGVYYLYRNKKTLSPYEKWNSHEEAKRKGFASPILDNTISHIETGKGPIPQYFRQQANASSDDNIPPSTANIFFNKRTTAVNSKTSRGNNQDNFTGSLDSIHPIEKSERYSQHHTDNPIHSKIKILNPLSQNNVLSKPHVRDAVVPLFPSKPSHRPPTGPQASDNEFRQL